MPNKPPDPTPPSRDDFDSLNANIDGMRNDYKETQSDSVDQMKAIVKDSNLESTRLTKAIMGFQRAVAEGTSKIAHSTGEAVKATGHYSVIAAKNTVGKFALDKETQTGRAGASAAGGLIGAVIAQSISDSGIGAAIKAKVSEGLSSAGSKTWSSIKDTGSKIKNRNKNNSMSNSTLSEAIDQKTKYNAKKINGRKIRSDTGGTHKVSGGISTIASTISPNKNGTEINYKGGLGRRYSSFIWSHSQNLKRSGDVIMAVDRLRISNQQLAGKTVAPTSKEIKEIKRQAPKAATGGTVQKGGLAEIHMAEIIKPKKEVDKQVRLLSAIYGLLENQSETMEGILSQYEDPASKKGGIFASLIGGFEMFAGHLFSGRYSKDIPRNKNPLVTTANGIATMYNWQRLYGEVQKDQMNALLQILSKNKNIKFEVTGRRGALLEWFGKSGKKISKKAKEMEAGPVKKLLGFISSAETFVNFDEERWRKRAHEKFQAGMDAAVFGEGEQSFMGGVRRAKLTMFDMGDDFEEAGTQVKIFSERLTDALKHVQEGFIKKQTDRTENYDPDSKPSWYEFWKNKKLTESQRYTMDTRHNASAAGIKGMGRIKPPKKVNDWKSSAKEKVSSIVTEAGQSIIPHTDDVISAVKKDKDPTLVQLTNIARHTASTAQINKAQMNLTKRIDNREERQEKAAAKKAKRLSVWERIKESKTGEKVTGLFNWIKKNPKMAAAAVLAIMSVSTKLGRSVLGGVAKFAWKHPTTAILAVLFKTQIWNATMKSLHLAAAAFKGVGSVAFKLGKFSVTLGKYIAPLGLIINSIQALTLFWSKKARRDTKKEFTNAAKDYRNAKGGWNKTKALGSLIAKGAMNPSGAVYTAASTGIDVTKRNVNTIKRKFEQRKTNKFLNSAKDAIAKRRKSGADMSDINALNNLMVTVRQNGGTKDELSFVMKSISKGVPIAKIKKTLTDLQLFNEAKKINKDNKVLSSLFRKYPKKDVMALYNKGMEAKEIKSILSWTSKKDNRNSKELGMIFDQIKNDPDKVSKYYTLLKKDVSLKELKRQLSYIEPPKSVKKGLFSGKFVEGNLKEIRAERKKKKAEYQKAIKDDRAGVFASPEEMKKREEMRKNINSLSDTIDDLEYQEQITGKKSKLKQTDKKRRTMDDVSRDILKNNPKLAEKLAAKHENTDVNELKIKQSNVDTSKVKRAQANSVQEQMNDATATVKASQSMNKNMKDASKDSANVIASTVVNNNNSNSNSSSVSGGGGGATPDKYWKNIDSILGGNVI